MDSTECCLLISATAGKLFLQEFRMRKLFAVFLKIIVAILDGIAGGIIEILLLALGAGLVLLLLYVFRLFSISPSIVQALFKAGEVTFKVAVVGAGMVCLANRWSRKREKNEEQTQHERATRWIVSATKKPWPSHQVPRIKASAGWYVVLICIICFCVTFAIVLFSS